MPLAPTHPDYAVARARSKAAIGGASRRQAANARDAKAAREKRLTNLLRHILHTCYPGAAYFPATDGWLWRDLADQTGAREGDLTTLAERAGMWPHKPRAIIAAIQRAQGADETWEEAE